MDRPNLPTAPAAEYFPRVDTADTGHWSVADAHPRLEVGSKNMAWALSALEPRARDRM